MYTVEARMVKFQVNTVSIQLLLDTSSPFGASSTHLSSSSSYTIWSRTNGTKRLISTSFSPIWQPLFGRSSSLSGLMLQFLLPALYWSWLCRLSWRHGKPWARGRNLSLTSGHISQETCLRSIWGGWLLRLTWGWGSIWFTGGGRASRPSWLSFGWWLPSLLLGQLLLTMFRRESRDSWVVLCYGFRCFGPLVEQPSLPTDVSMEPFRTADPIIIVIHQSSLLPLLSYIQNNKFDDFIRFINSFDVRSFMVCWRHTIFISVDNRIWFGWLTSCGRSSIRPLILSFHNWQ